MSPSHAARGLVLALLCGACARPAAPVLERLELAVRAEPASLQDDVLRSRAGVSRVMNDLRTGWSLPLGSVLDLDQRTPGLDPLTPPEFDVGLIGWPADVPVPDATVEFEIRASHPGTEGGRTITVKLADALGAWQSMAPSVVFRGWRELRLGARWVGAAPADGDDVRACFAPRRVHTAAGPTQASAERPNVLLISVDTLRADHLGCYGYARPTSPEIDRLAARSVVFERAYASAPWTLPSFGSLFTSRRPSRHRAGVFTEREAAWGRDAGVLMKTTENLRADLPTLAEVLRAAGWRTAGIHNNPYLGVETGIDRGFDAYRRYQYTAAAGTDLALAWLDAHGAERWFLFVHYMDPHYPYAPPDPYAERFGGEPFGAVETEVPKLDALRRSDVDPSVKRRMIDLYDGEIAYTDAHVGRLLARLEEHGDLARTLVVFHSDHGDEHWEHGSFDHGQSLHAELLHVPLIVSFPARVPGGRRVAQRVRLIDVMPTILELCGVPAPDPIAGRSLLDPLLLDRDAIAEAVLWGPREMKSLVSGRHKLIAAGASGDELFDIERDPGELWNVAADEPAVRQTLRQRLVDHHQAAPPPRQSPRRVEFPPGTRAHLANLGYAGDDGDEVHAAPPR